MPAGDVTRGTVYSIYPFDNTLTLIEIKGSDLLEAFNGIATYGGEPVSSSVKLTIKDKSVYSLEIGGEPVQSLGDQGIQLSSQLDGRVTVI